MNKPLKIRSFTIDWTQVSFGVDEWDNKQFQIWARSEGAVVSTLKVEFNYSTIHREFPREKNGSKTVADLDLPRPAF